MKNIYVFTIHKAASMLLYEVGRKLAHDAGIPFWSVNDGTFPERGTEEDPNAFDGKQGCFCPVRFCIDVPDIDDADLILHLRDPRDALTSHFFSVAYSHPRTPGKFNPTDEERSQWIEQGIDAHVLKHADRWAGRYQAYVDRVLGRPNTTFLRYEDMVTDFPTWLRGFMSPFPLAKPERAHKQLARKYRRNFDVGAEDVRRHKRQVTPGDHKRKLQPETIAALNETLEPILAALGYEP